MVTISQIQTGFSRYVNTQLAGAFDGWQKAVVMAGSVLITNNIPALIDRYGKNSAAVLFGVCNEEDGTVDIDAVHEALVSNLDTEKIPIKLPAIGTLKLGRDDIDALCRYIKEA